MMDDNNHAEAGNLDRTQCLLVVGYQRRIEDYVSASIEVHLNGLLSLAVDIITLGVGSEVVWRSEAVPAALHVFKPTIALFEKYQKGW